MIDGDDDIDIGECAVLLHDDGLIGGVEFALILKGNVVDLVEYAFDEGPFVLGALADLGDLDECLDEWRKLLDQINELVLELDQGLDDFVSC